MNKSNITVLDVIKAFYIGDELLQDIFDVDQKYTKKEIEAELGGMIKKVDDISQRKLLGYHLDNCLIRFDNYYNSTWEKKEIPLSDCGVWPQMGELPAEATHGSVIDTADYIRPYLKDKNKLTLKMSRVLYIEEMMKYAEIILKYIPIIVIEDGVIRQNKITSQTEVERKRYKKCKYDIDDGNHRALAYALLGKETIPAYVGKRVFKNEILYPSQ
ncbi:MAG: hypothetical protein WDZ70_02755 [Candidatus Paceibacterota bacterium]